MYIMPTLMDVGIVRQFISSECEAICRAWHEYDQLFDLDNDCFILDRSEQVILSTDPALINRCSVFCHLIHCIGYLVSAARIEKVPDWRN
jgi:hypothetical protein